MGRRRQFPFSAVFATALSLTPALSLTMPAAARGMEFDAAIAAATPLVRDAYTYLHENPELGKRELKAHAYLIDRLTALGFTAFVESKEAPTAVIAVLDSGRSGPTIALRAEMDARKLESGTAEPSSHSPRSKIDGLMHNCGHDVHAAILLGVASILMRNKERIAGKVVFLFQPAEEVAGGADDIVHEDILGKLDVRSIFAQHVAPGLPVGTIAISSGYALAGSSYFHLKLKGIGSHAAVPYEGTDTPVAAARIAQQLAEFPARHLDIANRPVVVSIARLIADAGSDNALPADAEMHGTVRAFEAVDTGAAGHPPLRQLLADHVARLVGAYGLQYEWKLQPGAPPTLNHPDLFARTVPTLKQKWRGQLDTDAARGMFSEDFAYYTAKMPALYFSLGIAKAGHGAANLHSADFDINSESLDQGLRLMTMLAVIGTRGTIDW